MTNDQYDPSSQPGFYAPQQPPQPPPGYGPPTQQYPYQPPNFQPGTPPRKRHTVRNAVLGAVGGVVALIVILAVALNGKTPTSNTGLGNQGASKAPAAQTTTTPATTEHTVPATGPANLNVGQTLDITQNGSPAGSVTITSMNNTTVSDDGYTNPDNGYFVSANVTVNSTINDLDVNELDFYVVENGTHYDEGNGNALFASSNNNDITTTLNAGESTSGTLWFDVPAIHGSLYYAPNYDGAPLADWSF